MSKNILKEIEDEIKRVENDERLKDVTFSKEGEDLLFARIAKYKEDKAEAEKKQSAYEFLSDEDRELLEIGRECKEHEIKYVKKRSRRMVVALAAALIATFAMGTVGITSRYKSLESVDKYAEEVQYRMLESEEDLIQADDILGEQEAKQQIEKFFGQPVLWLHGGDVGMKFIEYYIHENTAMVEVLYLLAENIVSYQIYSNSNKVSKVEVMKEERSQETILELEQGEYIITEYKEDGRDTMWYEIKIEQNLLHYNLSLNAAKMNEIEEILKNIK